MDGDTFIINFMNELKFLKFTEIKNFRILWIHREEDIKINRHSRFSNLKTDSNSNPNALFLKMTKIYRKS